MPTFVLLVHRNQHLKFGQSIFLQVILSSSNEQPMWNDSRLQAGGSQLVITFQLMSPRLNVKKDLLRSNSAEDYSNTRFSHSTAPLCPLQICSSKSVCLIMIGCSTWQSSSHSQRLHLALRSAAFVNRSLTLPWVMEVWVVWHRASLTLWPP
jgi:hypothetical protein